MTACAAAKKLPPPGWTPPSQAVDSVFSPTTRELQDSTSFSLGIIQGWGSFDPRTDLGAIHDIGAPIHVYPLFENGFRAYRRQSIKDNNRESAKIYADFAKVAEKNEYAWNYGKAATQDFIGTVSKRNRMICFPCKLPRYVVRISADTVSDTLLMNAFNTVNLACAVILTSTDYARELGIRESKWIYPLGGAGTSDSGDCETLISFMRV